MLLSLLRLIYTYVKITVENINISKAFYSEEWGWNARSYAINSDLSIRVLNNEIGKISRSKFASNLIGINQNVFKPETEYIQYEK